MNALRALWTLFVVIAWTVSAAILAVAMAHADPDDPVDRYVANEGNAVCSTLTKYPSLAGITGVGEAIHDSSGFTYSQAGRIIAESVALDCPQFQTLINEYVAVYAPHGTGVIT